MDPNRATTKCKKKYFNDSEMKKKNGRKLFAEDRRPEDSSRRVISNEIAIKEKSRR